MSDSTCYNVVTLDEIKSWCRIDTSDDDTLLTSLREACVDWGELYTNRVWLQRNYVALYEKFKDESYEDYPFIEVEKVPLQSIATIETMIDDVWTVTTSTYYTLKQSHNLPRVLFTTLPSYDTDVAQPIRVSFVAGYGDSGTDVPESLRTGLLCHINYLYHNRGDVISDGRLYVPQETKLLYNKYRVIQYF